MSNVTESNSNQQASSLGDVLRQKREALHLSLEDVSQSLRIRLSFLKALEENHIDQLPGIAYASGFLRAYAEFLGLDADEAIKRFRAEHQATEYKQKLLFPAPVPQSGVPAAVIIFIGFIIIVGGYIGWYKMTDHQKVPAETIPPIVEKSDSNNDQNKVSPQIASVMPPGKPDHSQSRENVKQQINQLESQVSQSNSLSKPKVEPTEHEQNLNKDIHQNVQSENSSNHVEKENIKNQNQSENASLDQSNPANVQIKEKKIDQVPVGTNSVIKASAASWLKIQDQEGHVLLQKTLQAGESWVIPADKSEVIMTAGNAGAVVIEQNGRTSKPLGAKGKVLRHFVITPERVKNLLSNTFSDSPALLNEKDKTIPIDQGRGKERGHSIASPDGSVNAADKLNEKQFHH